MRCVNLSEQGLVAAFAGVLLLGIAGCGAESPDPGTAPDEAVPEEVAADPAAQEPVADEEPTATNDASGIPSEHVAALDELDLPAAGTGVLELETETVRLEGISCSTLEDIEQGLEANFFRFLSFGEGTMADGSTLTVSLQRHVGDPTRDDYSEDMGYESDQVTLQILDETTGAHSDDSTVVRARRPLVGGPQRHDYGDSEDGLPLIKVREDFQVLTVTATAETLGGDRSVTLGGPFTLAMSCG